MADVHIEEHSSPSKTAKEAIGIMALTIIVSIVAILLIVQLFKGGMKIDPDSAAMSEEAIAERLKPVGEVSVESSPATTIMAAADSGGQPDVAVDAAGTGADVVADPGKADTTAAVSGEQVYNASCVACHATGLAGAPKLGDKAAWKARIAQGVETLYASAIKGKNTMPPKGGAMGTPDDDIKAAVDLMVAKSK